jgi:resuscitation-promoting factor RpfB
VLRSVKYGLNAAVLAGLVSVPVVWNSVDKTVNLVVDGQQHSIHTTADRVGEIVRDAGYRVTNHDLLAPAATSSISDGGRIVLRRGRLLHLDVDGVRADVWTTAPTVSDALAQLGYSTRDFVSVSRSQRLPVAPTDIAIRTPRVITIVHDGSTEQVTTTDSTIAEVLGDLGITVGAADTTSVPLGAAVEGGQTVRIERVSKRLITQLKKLPFKTVRRHDSALQRGTTKVVRRGSNGKARVTYSLVYVDGKLTARTVLKTVTLTAPKAQILAIGTARHNRVFTAARSSGGGGGGGGGGAPAAPAPSPGSAKAIARSLVSARGWGSEQYDCLVAMWDRESGWNVHASNPSGAYGIPQALPGSKMASAGPDWQNNATTQIKWGLGYISGRYGTPCGAWSFWQSNGWY